MPVVSGRQGLVDSVVGAVDQRFAETVRLSFMKNGRADPDRPQVEVQAVLRTGSGKETRGDGNVGKTWRTRITAGRGELYIDRAIYPDIVADKGDAVRALERPGKPVFEVLSVDGRNHARLILELSEK